MTTKKTIDEIDEILKGCCKNWKLRQITIPEIPKLIDKAVLNEKQRVYTLALKLLNSITN